MSAASPPVRRSGPWGWRRLAAAAATLAAALLTWGFVIEPRRLVERHVTLTPPGWPAALSGLKVAVLSDLHVGSPSVDADTVARVRAAVDAFHPDLVLLAGDLVVGHQPGASAVPPEAAARLLAGLSAPLGAHAVLGNHDWWVDGEGVARALSANGIRVLEDESVPLTFRGQPLWLTGLADAWTRRPDPVAALAGVPPGAPVIAFTHNPDLFPSLPARFSVVFAGHTHGGQVRLPVVGAPVVPSKYAQRYARGEVREAGRLLFVTTGVGTSILPVRFLVPPEVALVTLVAPGVGPSPSP
ncbi:MAG: metallophosphoesterase [Myxococcaceae bacterium]|jgi:predicted MPP superfamily phosphohydrolase|nr:metallophosphoesterase [Myxococcaceae bacterium]